MNDMPMLRQQRELVPKPRVERSADFDYISSTKEMGRILESQRRVVILCRIFRDMKCSLVIFASQLTSNGGKD